MEVVPNIINHMFPNAFRGSFLWDEFILQDLKFDVVSATYTDWFHCLLTSGGIVQCHVQSFLSALFSTVSKADFESFMIQCQTPRSSERVLSAGFLELSYSSGSAYFKMCGSSVYTFLCGLDLFLQIVLKPTGAMPEECLLMKLAIMIVDILMQGDNALAYYGTLKSSWNAYCNLYQQLHGNAFHSD